MLKILKAYGIPNELVDAIGKLYENTKARVLSADGETEFFDILAGVLQGDTFAPYIFSIVLDYAMRHALGKDGEKLGFELKWKENKTHPHTCCNYN